MYGMPDEIEVRAEGDIRVITLNRPEALNAVNDSLHEGLAHLWTRLSEDYDARAAVITGAGRAFSAGGDFAYLQELGEDPKLRAKTILHGREIVLGMTRCRVPVVAAVNGPAVGLGCSLVALSDIVYIAPQATSPTRTCRWVWSPPTAVPSRGRCTSACCWPRSTR